MCELTKYVWKCGHLKDIECIACSDPLECCEDDMETVTVLKDCRFCRPTSPKLSPTRAEEQTGESTLSTVRPAPGVKEPQKDKISRISYTSGDFAYSIPTHYQHPTPPDHR